MSKKSITICLYDEYELECAIESLTPKFRENGHDWFVTRKPDALKFEILVVGEDLSCYDDMVEFYTNYYKWTAQTIFHSNSYFYIENPHFKNIVEMKERAVPFIYNLIKRKNPNMFLFVILDRIFPNVVTTEGDGHCSISECRDLWLGILKQSFGE